MTSRDPLYDPNIRPEGSTLEEQIEEKVNEASSNEGGSTTEDLVNQGSDRLKQAGVPVDDMRERGQQAADQARQKGEEAMGQAKAKASEFGDQAHHKADEGLDKASTGLHSAAEKLREQGGQHEGQVGDLASTAAEKLDSASGYLRERDTDQMVSELEDLVRRKPVESLLVAAGVGLLLSRLFK
jgi:ElaB/YqjD/DUF883 family membrane-anchored ribosome-binding protein